MMLSGTWENGPPFAEISSTPPSQHLASLPLGPSRSRQFWNRSVIGFWSRGRARDGEVRRWSEMEAILVARTAPPPEIGLGRALDMAQVCAPLLPLVLKPFSPALKSSPNSSTCTVLSSQSPGAGAVLKRNTLETLASPQKLPAVTRQ